MFKKISSITVMVGFLINVLPTQVIAQSVTSYPYVSRTDAVKIERESLVDISFPIYVSELDSEVSGSMQNDYMCGDTQDIVSDNGGTMYARNSPNYNFNSVMIDSNPQLTLLQTTDAIGSNDHMTDIYCRAHISGTIRSNAPLGLHTIYFYVKIPTGFTNVVNVGVLFENNIFTGDRYYGLYDPSEEWVVLERKIEIVEKNSISQPSSVGTSTLQINFDYDSSVNLSQAGITSSNPLRWSLSSTKGNISIAPSLGSSYQQFDGASHVISNIPSSGGEVQVNVQNIPAGYELDYSGFTSGRAISLSQSETKTVSLFLKKTDSGMHHLRVMGISSGIPFVACPISTSGVELTTKCISLVTGNEPALLSFGLEGVGWIRVSSAAGDQNVYKVNNADVPTLSPTASSQVVVSNGHTTDFMITSERKELCANIEVYKADVTPSQIKACDTDNTNESVTIATNTQAFVVWNSSDATQCKVSWPGGSDSRLSGSFATSSPINASRTFSLECSQE